MREYDSFVRDPPSHIRDVEMKNDEDGVRWTIELVSPEESVYEGVTFSIDIIFGDEYPYKPPTVRFASKIFHPNVTFKGEICKEALGLDTWSVASTVRMFIPTLRNFLLEPDVSNPLNPEATVEYAKGMETYKSTVKRWLQTYQK